ncbi:SRF-TF-domain-containing protein [Backusella circina FSU 941]|nr:SRF-TF-domain-containing protein [Backusella circina FSU 941]
MNPSQLNPDLSTGPLDNGGLKKPKNFEHEDPNDSGDDSENEKPARRSGRRKIKIEYIEDKNRRHITFSKRKAGIMKKAYELSTLTGTQVLLLVVSETGLVYTFTTVKLQPIVTKPEGKNLIQACLNAPDPIAAGDHAITAGDASYNSNASPVIDEKKVYDDKKIEAPPNSYNVPPTSAGGYPSQPYSNAPQAPTSQMPVPNSAYSGHPGYISSAPQYQQSPQQQPAPPPQQQPQQPTPYGQIPQPPFYGNQQPHYMSHQQPPHPGYWQAGAPPPNAPLPRQDHRAVDDKSGIKK